jgi:uncharacterized membrane protein
VIAFVIRCHRFFLRQALYPVALSTLLACGIFGGRVILSGGWIFHFLVWNLFLAWIPFLLSLGATFIYQHQPRRWWILLGVGLAWLLFFPNAPYLLTDLLHLQSIPPVPIWYEVGLLAAFAWAGLLLAVFSLRAMQNLVKSYVGVVASWLFVFGVVGISGFGVYLGRFLRWNSWDLLLHPRAVLVDLMVPVIHPFNNLAAIGVTLLFATFLLVCYVAMITTNSLQKQS